jgi:hypothetical protein
LARDGSVRSGFEAVMFGVVMDCSLSIGADRLT